MGTRERSVYWQSLEVDVEGATLSAQSLGDAGGAPLLLVGAAGWSREWWADVFCQSLVDHGLRVIRYDARDTGTSTASPPGQPSYDADDLVEDAVAILDAFDIRSSSIVGLSMGGGLAQRLVAAHPDRVTSLVLMSTSPAGDVGTPLPDPTPQILASFEAEQPEPDWSVKSAVVDWVVESERPYAGPTSFDEAALRELVGRVWERTPSMASAVTNHFLVSNAGESIDLSALRGTPTLVVHGSSDPLFPVQHGQALATASGGNLLVLEGVGHQAPPPSTWPELVPAIAGHVKSALR